MKNKFVLTEEESKRILSLHKKAIINESNMEELDEFVGAGALVRTPEQNQAILDAAATPEKVKKYFKDGVLKVPQTFTAENAYSKTRAELKIFKGAKFAPSSTKGLLFYKGMYQLVGTYSGRPEGKAKEGTVFYSCERAKFTIKGQKGDNYYIEDYPIMKAAFRAACQLQAGGGGGTSQSGCPQIEKSFTDQGYVKITQKRYQELENDSTRDRKYKYCPNSKKNLYFAKVVSGGGTEEEGNDDGGNNNGGGGGGGGRRGQRYGFDYQEALNALKTKCPGSGGGGSEPQTPEYADDWRATQDPKEVQIDYTVDKNKVLDWAS